MKIDATAKIIDLDKMPGRVKKITGTRFAAILGLDPWKTDFEVWCDMTGTHVIPFEGNKYTLAGQTIEPKVIEYIDKTYFFGRGALRDPEAWYGKTKEQMRFDHFHDQPVFGGMWDARTKNAVFELKTTKRAEDWAQGGKLNPPEYYKLQGALYAYLLGLDIFYMVVTFLEDDDYDMLDTFKPNAENTLIKKFSLAAEYPDFAQKLEFCLRWREDHIERHISPTWDEKRKNDKEILAALRTSHVDATEGDVVQALLAKIEPLQEWLDAEAERLASDDKALKKLKEQLKAELEARMRDGDKKIEAPGARYTFAVTRAAAGGVDTERLKADGLYEQYKKSGYTTKFECRRNA